MINSKLIVLLIIALNCDIILAQVLRGGEYDLTGYGPTEYRPFENGLTGYGLVRYGALGLTGYSGLGLAGYGDFSLNRRAVVGAQAVGPIVAAIETSRTVQVVEVPTSPDVITPQTLIVEPNVSPLNIEFRSQSSPVNVNQVHIPGRPGEVQATRSEDEPYILVHEVVKPVIQEVRETILPYRRITQEIAPVQEEINSIVARGEQQRFIALPQVAVAQGVAQPSVQVYGIGLAIAGMLDAMNLPTRPKVRRIRSTVAKIPDRLQEFRQELTPVTRPQSLYEAVDLPTRPNDIFLRRPRSAVPKIPNRPTKFDRFKAYGLTV